MSVEGSPSWGPDVSVAEEAEEAVVAAAAGAVGWHAGGGISGLGGCRARRGRPRFLLTGGWKTGIAGAAARCFFKLQRLARWETHKGDCVSSKTEVDLYLGRRMFKYEPKCFGL